MAFADWDVPEPVLVLVLTREEAELLLAITQDIAGHSKETFRGMTDGIGATLLEAGVDLHHDLYVMHGSITANNR